MTIALSSNHNSVDGQTADAMSHLSQTHSVTYRRVLSDFPEYESATFGQHSSWFDTEAMGVDEEWGSWLADRIEQTGFVHWDDGEPYCTRCR